MSFGDHKPDNESEDDTQYFDNTYKKNLLVKRKIIRLFLSILTNIQRHFNLLLYTQRI